MYDDLHAVKDKQCILSGALPTKSKEQSPMAHHLDLETWDGEDSRHEEEVIDVYKVAPWLHYFKLYEVIKVWSKDGVSHGYLLLLLLK